MLQFISGAVVGTVTGWSLKSIALKISKREQLNREMIAEIVIMVVSLTWLISVIVMLNNPVFQVPFAIHALMGSVVGYLFKGENPILVFGKANSTEIKDAK